MSNDIPPIPPAPDNSTPPQPYQQPAPTPSYQQPGYNAPQPGYNAQPYAPAAPTNTLAIVSLILSIVGVGIGGIITGHIARKQIAQTGEGGSGLALAGLIIGYVTVGIGVIVVIFYVIAIIIAIAAGTAASSSY